jgi:hypothetical protein
MGARRSCGQCCVLCVVYCVFCVVCSVLCVLCSVFCVLCSVFCVLCSVLCFLCCVYFLVFISADCRVEYPKLGEYPPQQKLGSYG